MISLPVTSFTAIFAGALILLLTIKVIQLRRRGKVVLGDNDDRALIKAIRGHGNAAEQLPIALILLGLAEVQGASSALLFLSAGLLIAGRSLHAIYFAIHGTHWRFRFIGMWMTVLAQGLLVLILVGTLFLT